MFVMVEVVVLVTVVVAHRFGPAIANPEGLKARMATIVFDYMLAHGSNVNVIWGLLRRTWINILSGV